MIYITGDTHRDFSRLYGLGLGEEDLVIVLGDVGINYLLDSRDNLVKKRIGKLGCQFFFIRGNHEERPENIDAYDLKPVSGIVTGDVYMQRKYPRLMFATEGLYEIGGMRCFVTNGAYSVDKYYRLEHGQKWFESEELTDNEMAHTLEIARDVKMVEHVLSHTCPKRYIPVDRFLPFVDQSTVSRRMEEFLDELESIIEYKRWWCGHWHTDRTVDKIRFMYHDVVEFK